jgi:5-epi-alpha-selinene synthase
MQKLPSPELYCPFTSPINKYVDVLEDYSLKWVQRFNLLTSESDYKQFSKAKIFLLIASVYPYCQLENLKIANDWLSWVFIWDDQCDLSDLGKQPEALKIFHKRFLEILRGAQLTTQDIPLSHALSDLRERMLQRGSVKWFNYFVSSIEDYFQGSVQESTNRLLEIVPDIESYTSLRRLTVAAGSFIELIQFCDQLKIPDFVRANDVVKKLELMTINILAWCNDIFSAEKEMASGDVHNLVLVLHKQQNISITQALKLAGEMHNQEVLAMILLEKTMPSFGKELDSEIAKYILGMHAWIRGNFDWYFKSGRYDTLEKVELVKA